MLDVLALVMKDAIDFDWGNARSFYHDLGLDVEQKQMLWEDTDAIKEKHYARSSVTERKEQKENTRGQLRMAPTGSLSAQGM